MTTVKIQNIAADLRVGDQLADGTRVEGILAGADTVWVKWSDGTSGYLTNPFMVRRTAGLGA